MNFHEAERQYQRLIARREAGSITAADFDQAVQNLVIVDPAGARWRIGGLTGRWYRTQGDRWVAVSPTGQTASKDASITAVPRTLRPKWRLRTPGRQTLRAMLPTLVSLGCILMIYLVVALAALFDRGFKLAVVFPFLNPAPLAATSTETPIPLASLVPTFTLTPSPTSTVTPTPTIPPPLMLRAPQGPWLLIANAEGLWASAADGKALTRLSRQSMAAPVDLERATAPGGGLIAFVAAPDPSKPHILALNILRLPEVKPLAVIPLTAPNFTSRGDLPAAAALSAVVNRNSLA
ncbi:MAG: hypothetical protein U1B80_00395, partial [Anaerolineaceae bacterium]|nr:hypothetical protein [Anaerolineaceae bacterium]